MDMTELRRKAGERTRKRADDMREKLEIEMLRDGYEQCDREAGSDSLRMGLGDALAAAVNMLIRLIMCILTFGALPMPALWGGEREASGRGGGDVGAHAERRNYAHEWELLHHLEMSHSVLEGYTVY